MIITKTHAEPLWSEMPTLQIGNILWEKDCGVRASAQICYDDAALYLHLAAKEKSIREEYSTPLSPVHEDSCLEFFFMPDGDERYLNFEVNPKGCLHIGFGYDRKDRFVIHRRDAEELFRIRTAKTKDGWEVYYQIPLRFLQIVYPGYHFGGVLRANFYKCGDKTPHLHFLAWNPVTSATPDFHRPCDFGELDFG